MIGEESEDGWDGGHPTSVVEDNSHVEAQIGVVHSDVGFYSVGEGSTPADTYRVGRNYLDGNMPREAEKLIRDAFVNGHRSSDVSYYWALALLSNRSFDHLSQDDFDQLAAVFTEIGRREPDEWLNALGVVVALVRSLIAQQDQIDPHLEQFEATLHIYGRLPADRRDEIRRHLEMMLVGDVQDQLEAHDAEEVERKREDDGRRDRVWKFFEPKPEPPRRLATAFDEQRSGSLGMLVGGILLALGLIYLGGAYLLGGTVVLFVVAALSYAGGAFLLARYGPEQRILAAKSRWAEARFNGRVPAAGVAPEDRYARTVRFAAAVRALLAIRFDEHVPANGRDASLWQHESAGIRTTLAREIVEQYAGDRALPRVEALDWLVRFHADSTFASWEKGELFEARRRFQVPRDTALRSRAGVALLVVSVVVTAVNAFGVGVFLGPLVTLLWSGATVLVGMGALALREASAVRAFLEDATHQRLMAENRAFAAWQEALEGRPSDAEMATWIDHDKAHIKSRAMRHFGLANRDLIAHVILTGAAPQSYGARVLFGPPRYSDYVVQVFLLTEAGVRLFSVDLRLADGHVANERRKVFRYDAISSAEAEEVCIRIDGRRPETVDVAEVRRSSGSEKLVFSQRFTLSLNNTQSIEVLVGNLDGGLLDRMREDARHLMELARDTSGVNSAIRILEAIAADGSEWVRLERLRRTRRFLDYQRRMNNARELESGSTIPTPRTPPAALPSGPHRPYRELPRRTTG